MSSEDTSIQELVNIYNERKRASMKPNPLSIFFLKNGKPTAIAIAERKKSRPTPEEVMMEIRYKWKVLPDPIKCIYVKAAIELGFVPKQLFANNPVMKAKLDARIANAKNKIPGYSVANNFMTPPKK